MSKKQYSGPFSIILPSGEVINGFQCTCSDDAIVQRQLQAHPVDDYAHWLASEEDYADMTRKIDVDFYLEFGRHGETFEEFLARMDSIQEKYESAEENDLPSVALFAPRKDGPYSSL